MKIPKDTERIDRCILCGHLSISSDLRFRQLLGLVDPYDVQYCLNCGLRWLSPRPSAAGYTELYQYESYFNGPDAIECYTRLAAERRPYFRTRLEEIERCFTAGARLTILEIGSATGEFIHEAQLRGHTAVGIEVSEGARRVAKTLYEIELCENDLHALPENFFDAIHMSHVLEHLPNPLETLLVCHKLLRDDGLIVVEVPQQFDNDLDRFRRLIGFVGRSRFGIYSLHHTYFFTPSTLSGILNHAHFEVINMTTANSNRTPFWPFKLKHWLLRPFLWAADKLHDGGNIIEVYARKI